MPAITRRLRVALLGLLLLALAPAAASAAPTRPSQDAFYRAPAGLEAQAPGAVLRSRAVQVTAPGTPLGVLPATQVLYRTRDGRGRATATAATIIRPLVPAGPTRLLSYQTFYDGLADTCRPSYTLRGGGSGNTAAVDQTLLLSYVAQGYTVVTADYEGPEDAFGAGRESGYSTLDAIRAAQAQLGAPARTTPVGLLGYSGGSIASVFAGDLQADYAPELDVVGIAAGGVPAHFANNLRYIDGSTDWAGAIPAILLGLSRGYDIDLDRYLSARGREVVDAVGKGCLDQSAYPGLRFTDLLKPEFREYTKQPAFVDTFNDTIMSRSGTPTAPVLLGVGNADGTGDGVMVAKDVQQLARTYCDRGVSAALRTYQGADHFAAIVPFEAEAQTFLAARFAGLPATDECASITPGNPLTPLPPAPVEAPAPGTTTPSTSTAPAVPTATTSVPTAAVPATGSGASSAAAPVSPSSVRRASVAITALARSGGRLLVTVRCLAGGASCHGPVKVTTRVTVRRAGRARTQVVALVRGRVDLAAGASRRLALAPRSAAAKRLVHRARLRVVARARVAQPAGAGAVAAAQRTTTLRR